MDQSEFPRIERVITPEMVRRYGEVNGDRNMIHYDDQAARAAGFPRAVEEELRLIWMRDVICWI